MDSAGASRRGAARGAPRRRGAARAYTYPRCRRLRRRRRRRRKSYITSMQRQTTRRRRASAMRRAKNKTHRRVTALLIGPPSWPALGLWPQPANFSPGLEGTVPCDFAPRARRFTPSTSRRSLARTHARHAVGIPPRGAVLSRHFPPGITARVRAPRFCAPRGK